MFKGDRGGLRSFLINAIKVLPFKGTVSETEEVV